MDVIEDRAWAGVGTAVVITVLAATACSQSGKRASATATTTQAGSKPQAASGVAQTPKATLREAVAALLTAEQHGDHVASYALLDDEARALHPDTYRWRDRRNELPEVTGYQLRSASGSSVVAIVDHKPGLDPFIGLSPAQDRQTWTGRREHGGWLVDADPTAEPLLPPDSAVGPAVAGWLQAAEACDRAGAKAHEAIDPLLGVGDAANQLCNQHLTVGTTPPAKVKPGPATSQLIAQYNADALVWARSVALAGGPPQLDVVVAPIGATWQVIGVFG